jgi:uncharacterized protein (DUF2267 family)
MQAEEFFDRVQERGPGADRETALEAAKATIEALSYFLPAQEARSLAAQLPGELKSAGQVGSLGAGETPTGADSFYRLVADRANLDADTATNYARATITVLKQAISRGELTNVALSLPTTMTDILDEN